MKLANLENTAAAGATSALLILKAIQGLCLSFIVVAGNRGQVDTILSIVLSILMLGSGTMLIWGVRAGWKLAWFCVGVSLVWAAVIGVQHPSIFGQHDFLIDIAVSSILMGVITLRLRNASAP